MDKNPWTRRIYSRFPKILFNLYLNTDNFGGVIIKKQQKDKDYKVEYYVWDDYINYSWATTII